MRTYFKLLFFLSTLIFSSFSYGQKSIIGSGFANGWNNGDQIDFTDNLGSSKIATLNPNGAGNKYFRFYTDGTQYGPSGCTDTEWTANSGVTYLNMPVCGGGAFYINCPNTTDNYVFKTISNSSDDFIFFRIQGPVAEVSTVSGPTGTEVSANTAQTVTITTDVDVPTGQAIFLRYTTNGFSTSTVIKMTASSAAKNEIATRATDFEAQIPGQPISTTVNYYVFSSGDVSSVDPTNADWFSITSNTNGGSNYSYTTTSTVPVILTSYTAHQEGKSNIISWNTSAEKNNERFELYKSVDGHSWKLHSTMEAKWGRADDNGYKYEVEDKNPVSGLNYYQLFQYDFDGRKADLGSRVVDYISNEISIYPNPTTEVLKLNFSAYPSVERIEIRDVSRKRMMSEITSKGSESKTIEVSGLPAGMFFVSFLDRHGKPIYTAKFLKL